jgi:AcrR family transcriptional regulator
MVKAKKDQSTEEKILQAARQVFTEKGMDGARMQDIADKAGINKALLHYYFRNKDKLFEVIFTAGASRLVPMVNMLFESDMPLFDKIETFTREYIDMLLQNPYLPLFILNEINKHPGAMIKKLLGDKKPNVQKFFKQIEEEVKKGNIKPIFPPQLVINIVSMCVFPFVGKPMMQLVFGLSETQFRNLVEQRKTEVAKFVIDSIRK